MVARDLAEDSLSVGFASPWAGCNWYSFAEGGTPAAEWDAITFSKLAKLAEDHPDLCEKIPFCSVWDLPKSDSESEPWFKDLVFEVSRHFCHCLHLHADIRCSTKSSNRLPASIWQAARSLATPSSLTSFTLPITSVISVQRSVREASPSIATDSLPSTKLTTFQVLAKSPSSSTLAASVPSLSLE